MNRRAWIVVALVVAVAAPLVALSVKRKGLAKTEVATAQVQAQETNPLAVPASANAAASQATLPSGSNATEVYTKLTAEIEEQSKQASKATSPVEQIKIFESIAAKLEAFRSKYPNTPEALDATFQLGSMGAGMGDYKQAEQYLPEFIKQAGPSEHEKLSYAHYYLAETYKAQGKYDQAEAEYKIILRDFSDVNPRLTDVVNNNLASLASERKLAIGGEPVGFDVKSLKGERLTPSAYRGKVLLIDFWATWCGPCIAEMPNVKSVYTKYHGKGFEIVGISLDQSRDKLDRYIASNGIEWPQYFDGKWWNNDVAVSYGIKSIPATFLIDKKGKIRYKSLRGRQLEAAVEELLAEKV
jgi:thiol-disulfide isomerase/thioredoxin